MRVTTTLCRKKDSKKSPRVARETAVIDHRRRRPLMIELCEGGKCVRMWVKGERTRYTIPYSTIWTAGAAIMAADQRAAKAQARADRKRERQML
jgi:hypothetical protein